MRRSLACGLIFSLLYPAGPALAQRGIQAEPLPLLPGNPPASGAADPERAPVLPLPPSGAGYSPAAPPPPVPSQEQASTRVLCDQSVSFRLAAGAAAAENYRPFIGVFTDAAWTPALCAALVVETVQSDGTASVIYAYGPMGSNTRGKGGVLHGTGVVRDGELMFQNSDGSQYTFRPLYSDLEGRLTTPQGQRYDALFKKSY